MKEGSKVIKDGLLQVMSNGILFFSKLKGGKESLKE
jgi:hypothetical protein